MDFSILPFEGVENIKFGMLYSEVRVLVGLPYSSFKRSSYSTFPCDCFDEIGTFFYYDADGRLEAIEFFPPAEPVIKGLKLLGLDIETAKKLLAEIDDQIKVDEDGVTSYQTGLGIYAPLSKDNPSAPVEGVIAFRTGYYD